MQIPRSLIGIAIVAVLASAGCGSSKDNAAKSSGTTTSSTAAAPARTVAELAAYDSQLSTFATMLNVSGVLNTVGAKGPYTVFAPTNTAFAKLAHARLNALLARSGKQQLLSLIGGDVVRGRVALKAGRLKTLSGATLTLTKNGDVVTVVDGQGRSAKIVGGPLTASNGVVYRTDAVFAGA
jgi:uncharacterized surface protein with fasciclin (FAS1) repeats